MGWGEEIASWGDDISPSGRQPGSVVGMTWPSVSHLSRNWPELELATPVKPFDTSSDANTYSCPYHACTRRFDTPGRLQEHKRECHRQHSPSSLARGSMGHVLPQSKRKEADFEMFKNPFSYSSHAPTKISNPELPTKSQSVNMRKIPSSLETSGRTTISPNEVSLQIGEVEVKGKELVPTQANNKAMGLFSLYPAWLIKEMEEEERELKLARIKEVRERYRIKQRARNFPEGYCGEARLAYSSMYDFDADACLDQYRTLAARRWSDTAITSQLLEDSVNGAIAPTRRPKPRNYLEVVVQDRTVHAIPDTGASENVISLDLATSLGAVIERNIPHSEAFVNARGQHFTAVGTTEISCAFPECPGRKMKCTFSVIPNLIVPLVMGRQFLELTECLTSFRSRLKKLVKPFGKTWRVLQMEIPRRRFSCLVDDLSVSANPDTGSDVDLVSLSYARMRGWELKQITNEGRYVQFADGSVSELSGIVFADLVVGDNHLNSTKNMFFVLEGLSSDVLLGDDTLEQLDAYNTWKGLFFDIVDNEEKSDLNLVVHLSDHEVALGLDALLEDTRTIATPYNHLTQTFQQQSFFSRFTKKMQIRRSKSVKRAADIIGNDFELHRYLDRSDNINDRMQRDVQNQISKAPPEDQTALRNAESMREQRYQNNRAELLRLHAVALRKT